MIKQSLLALGISATLFSCEVKEQNQQLLSQIDSLEMELQSSQKAARMLAEVATLMDSIDAARNSVAINLEAGPNDNYKRRMEDIQAYVEETEAKIAQLEKSLQTSQSVSQTYAATIKKLKTEIASKNQELAMLQQQVEGLRSENASLVTTVATKDEEIAQKTSEIMSQSKELAEAEAKIQEMIIRQQISEADAYFARGEAVEEVANRTQLARKKKQASYKEALQLFEKSYALGRTDAKERMEAIQAKIK